MLHSLDRRRSQRYSILLNGHFTVWKQGKPVRDGTAKIRDVSGAGIFFGSEVDLTDVRPGSAMRLVFDWPVRQGKSRIDWIVDAIVVRNTPEGVAVNIARQRLSPRSRRQEKKLA